MTITYIIIAMSSLILVVDFLDFPVRFAKKKKQKSKRRKKNERKKKEERRKKKEERKKKERRKERSD